MRPKHWVTGKLGSGLIPKISQKNNPYQQVQFLVKGPSGDVQYTINVTIDDSFPKEGLSEGRIVALPLIISGGENKKVWYRTVKGEEYRADGMARTRELLEKLANEQANGGQTDLETNLEAAE